MPTKSFHYPAEFPREAFVQLAIETHFREHGFLAKDSGHVDLECKHPETGESWLIEAKGETSAVGLEFRTGLGQLVHRITDGNTNYGIAVPETSKFLRQCEHVSQYVRERLNLYILIIRPTGEVKIVPPSASIRA